MANQFVVSVANAVLRDPTTGAGIAYGIANIDSAFTLSKTETLTRGGINNPILYAYYHDGIASVKITQAILGKTYLALNAGTTLFSGAVTVLGTDCKVLTSGSAYLDHTPLGNVEVFLSDGTIQTVTPTGSAIYVSGGGNTRVDCIYGYTATAEQVTVETTKPPSVVDLTLIAQVRDTSGTIVSYLQINIPKFQVKGNYTLSLAANGVSTEALEGMALGVASTDCTTGEYYAKVTWLPASGTSIAVTQIAATPDPVTFSAASMPATQQLSVLGIRGGVALPINITSSCVYSKISGSASLAIHPTAGSIVATAAGAGTVGVFQILYWNSTSGSKYDQVNVLVTS